MSAPRWPLLARRGAQARTQDGGGSASTCTLASSECRRMDACRPQPPHSRRGTRPLARAHPPRLPMKDNCQWGPPACHAGAMDKHWGGTCGESRGDAPPCTRWASTPPPAGASVACEDGPPPRGRDAQRLQRARAHEEGSSPRRSQRQVVSRARTDGRDSGAGSATTRRTAA